MSGPRKATKFRLVEVDDFDARRGYKRCTPPGVSVYFGRRRPAAHATFWRDRTGKLVVRFSCEGYVFHFEASIAPDKQVPEADMHEFGDYVAETLLEWVDEGIDDLPSSLYET